MDDEVLLPEKDVWPFVTRLWCFKYYGPEEFHYSTEHEIDINTGSTIVWQTWIIMGMDAVGLIVRPYPRKEDTVGPLDLLFRITRVQTKGGVILKTPEDIMSFFVPLYNKDLDNERERRYDNADWST